MAIRDVTFRPVGSTSEGARDDGHALFITLDLPDPDRLAPVVDEAIACFTRSQLAGPPDTRFMLIVVHGDLAARELADAWRAAISHDAPALALLGTLQQADIMQCDREGRMMGSASLLASASA
jgi:hypothetical protein